MSPTAIARNIERVWKLRQHASDAFFSKQQTAASTIEREASDLARKTAAAIRASDHWASDAKDALLAGLETR